MLLGIIGNRFSLGAICIGTCGKSGNVLVGIFIMLGLKEMVPVWFVGLIVFRDLIIVIGFILYKYMTNEYKQGTLLISKLNTALLIVFILCHMVNLAVFPVPAYLLPALTIMIVVTTVVSGVLYVILWLNYFIKHTRRPLHERDNGFAKPLGVSVKDPTKTIEEK